MKKSCFQLEEYTTGLAELLSVFNSPFNLASGFASLDGFPSIVELLPLGQSEFHLRTTALVEVQAQRDERQPFLLRLAE